jgi:hypothetical protein
MLLQSHLRNSLLLETGAANIQQLFRADMNLIGKGVYPTHTNLQWCQKNGTGLLYPWNIPVCYCRIYHYHSEHGTELPKFSVL